MSTQGPAATHMDVTVQVPVERVGEFYEMFGRWLQGLGSGEVPAATQRRGWDPGTDVLAAAEAWARFPESAQRILGMLIDHPGQRFTGAELADELEKRENKKGARWVTGALAHPGRQLKAANRKLPFKSDRQGHYWMEPDLAALFAEARLAVDRAR